VADSGNFEVLAERNGSALIVSPQGEIDLATVDQVRAAIEREHGPGEALVVDLRAVGFMDSSGLRMVLELSERAQDEGFDLRVVRGPSAVQRVFEVSGLATRLPFVDDPSQHPPAGE
jgi:stage II sporulation protein AA (anti-sigma F factor antagonist)